MLQIPEISNLARMMVSLLVANPIWTWVQRLGGPGLILLGIVDNSIVPMPGGMDVMVILLCAHHREWWLFYAFMATIGAVIGGFLTYRLGKKGGEETLEKKIGKARAQKVYSRFRNHGFTTIVVGAVLPPPFPMVPLLVAAGGLHYPRKKFVAALGLGRAIRFVAVAFLAHVYGKSIIGWLSKYYKPLLYILLALGLLGAVGALIYFKWYRPRHKHR